MISFRTKNNSGQTLDMLQFASLLYLGIPLFLFFISWLKWYYALVMVTCLIIPLLSFNYSINLKGAKRFGLYFLVFCGFLLLLGYGEVFPQSGDWGKHNAIFSQLYYSWNQPVYIKYQGTNHILCYGLGFYMIPSWIAGMFKSYSMMRWLVLINSAIGLSLIGFWIKRIWKLPIWVTVIVFLLGNLDWISDLKWWLNHFDNNLWFTFSMMGNLQFISKIDQTPQHTIPTLLVFLIIFNKIYFQSRYFLFTFYLLILGFFWSPFIIFALIPFLFLFNIKEFRLAMNRASILHSLPIILMVIFIYSYYRLHLPVDKISVEILGIKQFVYLFLTRYSLLYGVNILIIFYVNWKLAFLKPLEVKLILIFFLISLIYNQINYGYCNDFAVKTSYIIIFILNIYLVITLLVYFNVSSWKLKSFVYLYLFFSSFLTMAAIYIKISSFGHNHNIWWNINLMSENKNILLKDALRVFSQRENYPFIKQYLGKTNCFSNEIIKTNYRK